MKEKHIYLAMRDRVEVVTYSGRYIGSLPLKQLRNLLEVDSFLLTAIKSFHIQLFDLHSLRPLRKVATTNYVNCFLHWKGSKVVLGEDGGYLQVLDLTNLSDPNFELKDEVKLGDLK
mmetsp:Transcript_21922/g.21117  ORF Transcript_21922/g.21117 Transcript_21922/m.21117 type:complete len:117 (+) Transcript_21922:871-1221(+)